MFFKATVFTVIVKTTLMITKMLFSRNAKDFRGGKRNLQNLNSVQKKCQPSVFTPEVQLEDWHRVDHDCFDVPAFKRKIERLQKLCRGLRPIFASSSDRTLGWIRTHSRGDQITNQPTVRVCKSRPTVRFWSAQKICTVVMCTHSTTPLCETAILLVQPRSQRHRRSPENFPRSQNHNDPTFGRCHSSTSCSQVVELCSWEAAMFCSTPHCCCHVVSPPDTQRCCCSSGNSHRLGLAAAGAKKIHRKIHRNQESLGLLILCSVLKRGPLKRSIFSHKFMRYAFALDVWFQILVLVYYLDQFYRIV